MGVVRLFVVSAVIIMFCAGDAINGEQSYSNLPKQRREEVAKIAWKAFHDKIKTKGFPPLIQQTKDQILLICLDDGINAAIEAVFDTLRNEDHKSKFRTIEVGSICFTKIEDKAEAVIVRNGPANDGTYLLQVTGFNFEHGHRYFRTAEELYFEASPKKPSAN